MSERNLSYHAGKRIFHDVTLGNESFMSPARARDNLGDNLQGEQERRAAERGANLILAGKGDDGQRSRDAAAWPDSMTGSMERHHKKL